MDRNLLERIIKRLKEKEMIDREYMDADDLGALRNEIAELKKLLPTDGKKLYDVTVKYIETYEIIIEAECQKEAEEIAYNMYTSGQLILHSQHTYVEAN